MDPLTIGMLVILAVLIFFMFRNSRKRKAQQEELKSQIVPGKEIMTNFGLFGTLKSIDEVSNVAEVETSPGNIVRVHRQTIAKVVDDTPSETGAPRSVEEAMEIANREEAERTSVKLNEDTAIPMSEPAYGERVHADSADAAASTSGKKPAARRTTVKKVNE
jgi:preprotein translocase subunit YajC